MRKLFFILMTVILIVGIFFAQSYRINPLLNKKLDYYSANTDVAVAIDSAATAGYLGAASSDGVLRTGVSLSYTDGGDFVTINAIQDIRTSAGPTFESLQLNDDTTVAYDLILDSDSDGTAFTADRTLTFDLNNANRVIDLSGDLTLSGANKVADWEVTGNLQNSGAALTVQDTGGQDVHFFASTTTNENIFIYGYRTAVGVKYFNIGVDSNGKSFLKGERQILFYGEGTLVAEMDASSLLFHDDKRLYFGSVAESAIEYDEAGDNTMAHYLPSAGISLRTAGGDNDNALLIKVAKVVKAHDSDLFDAAGLTDSATIWTQPANSVLLSAKYILDTQFVASGLSDLDITKGLAGDNDGLIAPAAHNLTSDTVGDEYTTRGAYWSATTTGGYHASSATDWIAYSTAVGANLNTTSAGQVTFYFAYIDFSGT